MKNKLLFSIIIIVVISLCVFSVTYAYYELLLETEFSGEVSSGVSSKLSATAVYESTSLVPLADEKISTAISKNDNKCIDKNGYQVCSLYRLTLNNTSESENLYGYVRTESSTYTTDNLKYQVFDSNYIAITDVMNVSKTAGDIVYFEKDSSEFITASHGTQIYFLAIWLHDTDDYQDDDYSKSFTGYVGFESASSLGSGRIEASL